MMTYPKHTAIQMVGTVLIDHELVYPGFNGMPGQIGGCENGSPASRAREQAAELLDDYSVNSFNESLGEDVPAKLVTLVISDLLDEIAERTGERPEMPVAFFRFRC